ncbi:MAG: cytidyltransferase, partial [Thaumarchaeota archaeon]|nr:cytidyltransferase [Nitrososphaerota archaeon]
MDIIDKKILTSVYVCSITGENPITHCIKKTNLSETYINDRIDALKKNLLLSESGTLTEFGRTSLH